ncbi:cobalt ABC transporter permease [Spirochaetia bacterium]|nr:cobalt ABC transporter permease [Spirochaetia bacterium]
MAFSSDFYIHGASWLHRLDPRVKLLMTGALMITAFRMSTLLPVIVLLAFIHLLLLSARIPKSKFIWVWKMMLPITIMIGILWPFFYHEGTPLFEFGIIRITVGGILRGAAMALRICILAFACFILLFSTDQAKIVRALVKLGVPYRVGLMLAITLRYIPTFFGIITMVTDAQKARGLNLDTGSPVKKLKAYMPILAAVLITGLKTSDSLSNALETRAFSASVKHRTYYRDIAMRPADYVLMCGIVLSTVVILRAW